MNKQKIFSRIFKDSEGRIGFTFGERKNTVNIYDNKLFYKNLYIIFKLGIHFKDQWFLVSMKPMNKVIHERELCLEYENKYIPYSILFKTNEFFVDKMNSIANTDLLDENENLLLRKLVARANHPEGYTKLVFNYSVCILGQNGNENGLRYPVSILVDKNTKDFLYKEKSFLKDELLKLNDDGTIDSCGELIIEHESETYNECVKTWLKGFEKYQILNKETHKYEKHLKKVAGYILDNIFK